MFRYRNRIREQTARSIFEKDLETIQSSEHNRYLLHWNGKMLQGPEHVKTSIEVIAVLLTVTHGKKRITPKIENMLN